MHLLTYVIYLNLFCLLNSRTVDPVDFWTPWAPRDSSLLTLHRFFHPQGSFPGIYDHATASLIPFKDSQDRFYDCRHLTSLRFVITSSGRFARWDRLRQSPFSTPILCQNTSKLTKLTNSHKTSFNLLRHTTIAWVRPRFVRPQLRPQSVSYLRLVQSRQTGNLSIHHFRGEWSKVTKKYPHELVANKFTFLWKFRLTT